jgi:hypothetical protein
VDWLVEANVSEKRTVLKMETVRFSETFVSISQSTLRPNPEEHHHYRHRRGNLKSHIMVVAVIGGGTTMTMKVSHPTLPQMNFYGLRLLIESATNSKHQLFCTQGSVSLNSYRSCVQCSALCWKQFHLKKIIITSTAPKNGQICYKKTWR